MSSRARGNVSQLLVSPLPGRHLATAQDPIHVLKVKTLKLLRGKYEWRHENPPGLYGTGELG